MGKKIIIIPIVFLIAVLGIRTYNKIEEYKIPVSYTHLTLPTTSRV